MKVAEVPGLRAAKFDRFVAEGFAHFRKPRGKAPGHMTTLSTVAGALATVEAARMPRFKRAE